MGPGNAYVAAAKREVFGQVGIDCVAGPSEILVIADAGNDPEWIAADLLSQAEHDASSQSILITDDAGFADRVAAGRRTRDRHPAAQGDRGQKLERLWRASSWSDAGRCRASGRRHRARASGDRHRRSGSPCCRKVRHAGAIFLGRYTPEAMGDYIAGPNHVLPTSRTARFSSGSLGAGLHEAHDAAGAGCRKHRRHSGPKPSTLAEAEGLDAHARSIAARLNRKD